ncbi:MAG: exopolysaccharide biosynthesis protein [Alphaproteobacteria bacterium]|nr:exopolysaccharide biosynthesis protein [Alphaproteobacteria bacterium]
MSGCLEALAEKLPAPETSIDELRRMLSGRIYGMLLPVLAIPNFVPFPVPGLSAMLGLPLLLLTFQMMLGHQQPWLPEKVLKRRIKTEHLRKAIAFILPYLRKVECVTAPRWKWMLNPPMDKLIAAVCVFLSLMIMLPVPFGNALPALAICFFSIAMMQRDGACVCLGMLCAVASVAVSGAFIGAAATAFWRFWS